MIVESIYPAWQLMYGELHEANGIANNIILKLQWADHIMSFFFTYIPLYVSLLE